MRSIRERRYTDITEQTPTIINEFIERIKVRAPIKVNGKRHQDINIIYNAVGVINIPTDDEVEVLETEYRTAKQKSHKNT